MKALSPITALIFMLMGARLLPAQDQKPANLAAAPPNIALLVHQEIFPGKFADHKRLLTSLSRASDRAESQRYWIDLESLTGNPDEIIFSAFDSYEHLEHSDAEWN